MGSGYDTKILVCAECGEEFVFTIAAQEYFAEKGYTEDPRLCKSCYMQHKRDKKSQGSEVDVSIDMSAVGGGRDKTSGLPT